MAQYKQGGNARVAKNRCSVDVSVFNVEVIHPLIMTNLGTPFFSAVTYGRAFDDSIFL